MLRVCDIVFGKFEKFKIWFGDNFIIFKSNVNNYVCENFIGYVLYFEY